MDFFEHQDAARRKTGQLVVLMVLAVAGITAAVFAVVVLAYVLTSDVAEGVGAGGAGGVAWARVPWLVLLGGTAAGVLLVVGGGSAYKMSQLAGGGRVVAESLGGREVEVGSADPDERRLLNVVQEMAIASGSPVPRVFVLDDEEGINAFAAGWSPEDAVIGVTRGGVRRLSRDELQGVIAHEFSHILHGDMRINLRLVGLIFGILAISVIGGGLVRSLAYSGGHRRRRGGDRDGQAGVLIAMFLVGAALYVIGYVGVFFGRLIQAAVSRQREFLADASAVQYTRNPQGIGDALRRIGGLTQRSRLETAHASEHRHLFFGSAGSRAWLSLLATHPPLDERIARVMPDWDRTFLESRAEETAGPGESGVRPRAGKFQSPGERARGDRMRAVEGVSAMAGSNGQGLSTARSGGQAITHAEIAGHNTDRLASTGWESIGRLTAAHVRRARELIANLPAKVYEATRDDAGAQAVVLALLSDRGETSVRRRQRDYLRDHAESDVVERWEALAEPMAELGPESRLPLLDLAWPMLRGLSATRRAGLLRQADALIAADDRVLLFEWSLRQVLGQRLNSGAGGAGSGRRRLGDEAAAAATLVRALADTAGDSDSAKRAAWDAAVSRLPAGLLDSESGGVSPVGRGEMSVERLGQAVTRLRELRPLDQRAVMRACTEAVVVDGRTTVAEAELLRAVAESLGLPMPPRVEAGDGG